MKAASQSVEIVGGAPFLVLSADQKAAADLVWNWRESGLITRVARGRKMRTIEGLFNELAAALQFPHYFGENWDALDECLADMDWIPTGTGIVVMVTDAAQVLVDEAEDALALLVHTVSNAAATYAEPIAQGEWWDRPAIPFYFVLQQPSFEPDDELRRWINAGAEVAALRTP